MAEDSTSGRASPVRFETDATSAAGSPTTGSSDRAALKPRAVDLLDFHTRGGVRSLQRLTTALEALVVRVAPYGGVQGLQAALDRHALVAAAPPAAAEPPPVWRMTGAAASAPTLSTTDLVADSLSLASATPRSPVSARPLSAEPQPEPTPAKAFTDPRRPTPNSRACAAAAGTAAKGTAPTVSPPPTASKEAQILSREEMKAQSSDAVKQGRRAVKQARRRLEAEARLTPQERARRAEEEAAKKREAERNTGVASYARLLRSASASPSNLSVRLAVFRAAREEPSMLPRVSSAPVTATGMKASASTGKLVFAQRTLV